MPLLGICNPIVTMLCYIWVEEKGRGGEDMEIPEELSDTGGGQSYWRDGTKHGSR
jgi:hypothetical protein